MLAQYQPLRVLGTFQWIVFWAKRKKETRKERKERKKKKNDQKLTKHHCIQPPLESWGPSLCDLVPSTQSRYLHKENRREATLSWGVEPSERNDFCKNLVAFDIHLPAEHGTPAARRWSPLPSPQGNGPPCPAQREKEIQIPRKYQIMKTK